MVKTQTLLKHRQQYPSGPHDDPSPQHVQSPMAAPQETRTRNSHKKPAQLVHRWRKSAALLPSLPVEEDNSLSAKYTMKTYKMNYAALTTSPTTITSSTHRKQKKTLHQEVRKARKKI